MSTESRWRLGRRLSGPPRALAADEWRYVLRRTVLGFVRTRGIDAAGALTYFACLALFPIALTLLSSLALVAGSARAVDGLLDLVGDVAQPATVRTIRGPLLQLGSIPVPGLALGVGLALTVWTVSAYATCFGRTLDALYGVQEGRRILRFRGGMMVLSVPLIVGGAAVTALVLSTPTITRAIAVRVGVGEPWIGVYSVLRWPLAALVLALMLGALYLWAPNVERQAISPISWGAGVAIVGCVVASTGFALYIATVGQYGVVYGWLGGALVLLLWLYLINVVLVYGASLDTEIVRMHLLRRGLAAEDGIDVPLRDDRRARSLAEAGDEVRTAGREIRERHYRGAMATRGGKHGDEPAGTPSEEAVEQDFSMPGDADLRPSGEDTADGTVHEDES